MHRLLFRVALWLIPVGLLAAAGAPVHRVALLHITFVAGLTALTFATSVHVALLHTRGREAEAERTSVAVALSALLLYSAAVVRVGADWLGSHYLAGLTAAAVLLLLALLLWTLFLLLKLRPARS